MEPQQITLEEAMASLLRHPVLVLGPSATTPAATARDLCQKIRSICDDLPETTHNDYLKLCDAVKATAPSKLPEVRQAISDHLLAIQPAPSAIQLATGNWSAIVSLCADMSFEDHFKSRLDRQPSSWDLVVVDHTSIIPPPQTTPVYRLLGNPRDQRIGHELSVSTSDYLTRKQQWPNLLTTLPENARNAPFLFVGTDTSLEQARDLLGVIYGSPPPHPQRLMFLKGDGTIHDHTIRALASGHSEVRVIDCSLKDFCEATANTPILARTIPYAGVDGRMGALGAESESAIHAHARIVELAPTTLPDGFDPASNRRRLLDGLFRPVTLDWLPFLCDFDLQRTSTDALLDEIETKITYIDRQEQSMILLRGEAGIGKSTCLKRAAISMRKRGRLSFWCKRPPFGTVREAYTKLAKDVGKRIQEESSHRPAVVFCDDPFSLRVDPRDLIRAFEIAKVPCVIVVAARNSDVLHNDSSEISFPVKPDGIVDLPHILDENELARLPEFLVRLGIAPDERDAEQQVLAIPRRDAEDILCSLWYLLPETKGQLTASIQDEYARLGGVSGVISAYADEASRLSDHARRAYEFVAVCSGLNIGLPLEVLVSALGIGYGEWMDMCVEQRPVWGLIYDDCDDTTENIVFQTRNHVVTRVLLELVNGGSGHAGEFRILKDLVRGCTRATVPYRSFLIDLLVTRKKRLGEILTYDWGVELYELAMATFPEEDRTIAHHFGSWHRWVGKNPTSAYEQYQKALGTHDYPYTQRIEPKGHIHTSMAATVVEMVRKGEQDRENALELVEMHLQEARRDAFVDPHSDHVFANALFQLSKFNSTDGPDATSLHSVAESLRTIEQSLQLIGASGRKRREFVDDIRALHELQGNILDSIENVDEIIQYANEAFENSGSQSGFEVVARRLLRDAENSSNKKGGLYKKAYDYANECIQRIEDAGRDIGVDILSTRIDIFVRWRLQHTRGPVEWERLKDDLETVTSNRKYSDDLVKLYYLALALFHLEDFTRSEALFRSLQRMNPSRMVRLGRRNAYLGDQGFPKRIQVEIRSSHNRRYVYAPSLGLDLDVFGRFSDRQDGAVDHCYIVFSLAGPIAVFDSPSPDDAMLA